MTLLNMFIIAVFWFVVGCQEKSEDPTNDVSTITSEVTQITTSGSENNYNFSVELSTDDTGCDQYADWWEVITPEGELLYRRILAHSHVNEQPFTRSGGPVKISSNQEVVVRLHMNNTGYSASAMKGSINAGFEYTELPDAYFEGLESAKPQPSGCAF